MKHIIVGTAGHVDHGKTELVKALTGIDTDTLLEEKKRGITINNGYAYMDIASSRVAIIDVPGHEKFVKNMVSGVSSIDLVLFIIAADEGIMPQTREHLEILKAIDVKNAIVVLTKSDLVDDEWLSFMKDEVREFLAGSFMADSKIIDVSAKIGKNIDLLIGEIEKQIEIVEQKDRGEIFRMPVDRVFTVNGFGTVVTGSIVSGSIKVSDELSLDNGDIARVRGIQVHGESKDFAVAGERCAINIAIDSKIEIKKGIMLTEKNKNSSTFMVDVKLNIINDADTLSNRQRIRVYHYANEVMARAVILDKDEIKAGESGYVQLRLESEISAKSFDKIVIRSYSPMKTIGGGVILNSSPKKAKRFKADYIEALKFSESGDLAVQIENIIREKSSEFINISDIRDILNVSSEEIILNIEKLIDNKKIIKLSEDIYVHNKYIQSLEESALKELEKFYKASPLKLGMNKDALKNKIINKKIKSSLFDSIISILIEQNILEQKSGVILPFNYSIKLSKQQEEIKDNILKIYTQFNFTAGKFEDIIKNEKNKKEYKIVLELLVSEEELIFLEDGLYITKQQYEDAKIFVIDFINKHGGIKLSDLKERVDTSRRYLVAFFELLDRQKITKREDEIRILI